MGTKRGRQQELNLADKLDNQSRRERMNDRAHCTECNKSKLFENFRTVNARIAHDKVCKGEPPLFSVGSKPRLFGMGMSKTAFVKACVKVLDSHYRNARAGESWIRERVSESGNEKELELARAHPEMILVFADTFGTERVLDGVYTLEGIEVEIEAKGIKT
jgi:hypothetical protein